MGITVGGAFAATGAAMLVCALVGLVDGESALAFAVPGFAVLLTGWFLLAGSMSRQREQTVIRPITGLVAVTLAWTLASAAGAVPLILAGSFSSPLDAYFEAVSGFTTTGATLLADIEAQSQAVLVWRSLMQWLGGVGIIVLVVAVAPISGPGVQRAFYAETSGMVSDRLTPRIIDTAKIIAGIYLVLSVIAAVAYLVAGMGLFDAVNHSMTTIATGGYSTKNLSIGAFDSRAIESVAVFFMIVGGINFAFYWRAIRGRSLMPQLTEVLGFLGILLAVSTAVAVSVFLADDVDGFGAGILDALFSVTTVITTTGFTTADFDDWNSFARTTILVTTFIGACAGSTAGGIKVIRVMLLGKSALQELQRQLRPNMVQVLRVGGHVYREEIRRAVLGFFLIYLLVYAAGVLAMAASGLDPLTAISAASATLNMIGPGLGEIGAIENFETMSPFARGVSCVLMIAGRLEVFTVVALGAAAFGRIRSLRAG
ncbi:MAG: TrkH family potassium uptake protein [Solirubrobacterales bacterium]